MNAPIPEDLRTWYSVACDKVHFKTDYDAIKILIERIAALTPLMQERDQLRAEVERLSAALKSIDCASCGGNNLKHKRGCEQAIIARRKA